MQYNDIPEEIRILQGKIDAIYDSYIASSYTACVIDPNDMKYGHRSWIGRYTQQLFRLIEQYDLDAAQVLWVLSTKNKPRIIKVD